ncbi:hypothetical protein [Chelativorans sp. AA-79]|uniref:hypothetical protein n=1 Tax=Chelativorans sp. AA-79 TaxID=3028735 RepID=UPI0023F7D352|nr:hypothetical protein [Chelativorans sp. AA-79]WEX09872.1 hypothetical protein PVE73_02590 [Chelativorans sp. AA-79]
MSFSSQEPNTAAGRISLMPATDAIAMHPAAARGAFALRKQIVSARFPHGQSGIFKDLPASRPQQEIGHMRQRSENCFQLRQSFAYPAQKAGNARRPCHDLRVWGARECPRKTTRW